ncbi:MAG TPA: anti-sigma factor antagonist [Planctomycetaceae bacterium]|nr:anti-sigma factor antagonist [Planctomycetaceae bacterium]
MVVPELDSPYLRLREEDGVLVVSFECRGLDEQENIEELGYHLISLVEKYGCRKLVVDLEGVEIVGSVFLAKLITLHRRLHRAGGKLVVCGFAGVVAETLHISRLDEYLHTAPDVSAALACFA